MQENIQWEDSLLFRRTMFILIIEKFDVGEWKGSLPVGLDQRAFALPVALSPVDDQQIADLQTERAFIVQTGNSIFDDACLRRQHQRCLQTTVSACACDRSSVV